LQHALRHATVAPVFSPKVIITLSRVLVRDTRLRRTAMFYLALAAILMVFLGSAVVEISPRAHPFAFLAYWGVCAWLTLAVVLLALFDILAIRAAGRAARRKLERELISENDSHPR
jgi:hypothetical protein